MPKKASINGPRAAFLKRFLEILFELDKGPNSKLQKTNDDRHDFYETVTRALVLCFGHENTLKNDVPGPGFDVVYTQIPAANKMPDLPEPEAIERDRVIKELTPVRQTMRFDVLSQY